MKQKNDDAYKSIGEVAKDLNLVNLKTGKLNTHTIRFWEKEFKQIKPIILKGNRRYYDKKNIELLKKVYFLLKDQGMTIKGSGKIEQNFEIQESLELLKNKCVYKTLKFMWKKILKLNLDNLSILLPLTSLRKMKDLK